MLRRRTSLAWWLAGAAVALLGALAIVRADIAARREAFQTDARVAHRLLSQRAVQHEAILATLTLLQPGVAGADPPEARLPAVYPQLLAVLRRDATQPWPDAALQAAEDRSRQSRHAELAAVDVALGQYTLVQAGTPGSFALRIAVQAMVPWDDWPVHKDGPVQVALVHGTQTLAVQAGAGIDDRPAGLTPGFVFAKTLAAPGQPFELQLRRATGPAQWPWVTLLAWLCGCAATVAGLAAWQRARQARRRAEALLRVDQVARLNAMGELAAGMAHELNQPLAAAMAGAQAARRLLDDDPPELDTARQALGQVVAQGRRAADVVARLRRQVESPTAVAALQPVALAALLRQVLALREPELQQRGVQLAWQGDSAAVAADPVALEQVLHNLVGNALQALDGVPPAERRLEITLATGTASPAFTAGTADRQAPAQPDPASTTAGPATHAVLTLRDSGPGIAADALPHLFEPFFTTRPGGLGLGLSLCESLVHAMHGTLQARNAATRGAEFILTLPLAATTP
jgi:signal transduction histidine kinase